MVRAGSGQLVAQDSLLASSSPMLAAVSSMSRLVPSWGVGRYTLWGSEAGRTHCAVEAARVQLGQCQLEHFLQESTRNTSQREKLGPGVLPVSLLLLWLWVLPGKQQAATGSEGLLASWNRLVGLELTSGDW